MMASTSLESQDTGEERPARVRGARRHLPALVVLVVGFLVSAVLAWTCWTVNDRNETRLLGTQVQEAGAVVTAALPSFEAPLASALTVAQATGGSAAKFSTYLAPSVGAGHIYTSVSLLALRPVPHRITLVGQPPLRAVNSPIVVAALAKAERTGQASVSGFFGSDPRRVGYALVGPGGSLAIYGESALPSGAHLSLAGNSAFSDLDFALYLGPRAVPSQLLGSSDPSSLPLTGRVASTSSPFGNGSLLLVAKPSGELGGSLLNNLFWIVALAGIALTLLATWITERLIRDRRVAEQLAVENRLLYGQQRGIAQTLQRALLPEQLPQLTGLEAGVRYRPGVEGMDVGGDWCDLVELTPSRCLVVVGDVSGSGLAAATTMASLHYAIRAYAAQGDSPSSILTKLSRLLRVESDAQFASVLCGIVDVDARRMTLANAGHLPPLLVANGSREFVSTAIGPPIGVGNGAPYAEVTVEVPPGATVLVYTDGLVERRGENIDDGLARLRSSANGAMPSLDGWLTGLVDTVLSPDGRDDTAILGLRWTN